MVLDNRVGHVLSYPGMKILDVPRSGSYQGVTSSRNRFGQYVRARSTPVQPRSPAQVNIRENQTLNAAAWRALTSGQRSGWGSLGLQMVRTDALGQQYSLTGFQAYCSVNNVLRATAGTVVSDAPALQTPTGLTSVTLTLTAASFSFAYTPTPLPASTKLIVRAGPQRSAGRSFEADYRIIKVSTAAQASPLAITSEYTAKFGVPVVGNKIFTACTVMFEGFESLPLLTAQVVA